MHFFSIFLLKYFATFRKKHYLCIIKITNNRAAQLVKHCTETMTQQEVKAILSANRELVINYYAENCAPRNKFYDLKWFMGRVLVNAEISWAKRKNIAEKDVMAVIKSVIKSNPQLLKGYMSNWEKAVRYHGYDLAKKIADCK